MYSESQQGSSLAATPLDDRQVSRLVESYRETDDRRSLERIFELHGRILNHIVRRYARTSGEPYEDLLQVGYVGLVKAANGYASDSSARFSSYAYSMIDGELRHHFRDTGMIKKPRWARSLYSQVAAANVKLTAEMIRRIRQIDWTASDHREQAFELYKELLVEKVRAYWESGDRALIEYADQRKPVDLRQVYPSLLERSVFIKHLAPEFENY